jgi:two-component system, NtrC family, nitrogen regulation response regulator NtrX
MPKIFTVLIVDDDKAIRESLAMILRYERYRALEAAAAKQALEKIRAADPPVHAIFCDVKMPGMDGLELLDILQKEAPQIPVIMISGHGTHETAVDASRRGAYDFIEKPLDQERVLLTLRNAVSEAESKQEARALRGELAVKWRIIGESPEIREVRAQIERVAAKDVLVLVTGENGTGKELVARNLHALSKRAAKPFVDVNCAAIPKELVESELFGHEKGAFTGAAMRKIGKFEQADGGTLFLDEIGDMDLAAQAKVLRVLETGEIQRVGSEQSVTVDVRVVAATNRNLEEDVKSERFREDLFYRLNVIQIHMPPLRERPEDVVVLLTHFTTSFCKKHNVEQRTYTQEALDHLKRLKWAGNVRELRNFTEKMVLLSAGQVIDVADIEKLSTSSSQLFSESIFSCPTFEEFKEMSERLYIEKKLRENDWNIKKTAESIGMQRSNLYKKLDRYKLK